MNPKSSDIISYFFYSISYFDSRDDTIELELFSIILGSLGSRIGNTSLLALAGKLNKDYGRLMLVFLLETSLVDILGFV